MSKFKLYIPEDASWSEILTEYQLALHKLENATLTNKGHVQLSNATDSTSETLASTPKALSDAIILVKQYSDTLITNLISNAPSNLNDLNELATAIQDLENNDIASILTQLGNIQTSLTTKSDITHVHTASEIADLINAIQSTIDNSTIIIKNNKLVAKNIEGLTSTTTQIDNSVSKSHEHSNNPTLNKLTESNGKLLFDGQEISSNSGGNNEWEVFEL